MVRNRQYTRAKPPRSFGKVDGILEMLGAVCLPDAPQQLSERRVVASAQYAGDSLSRQHFRGAVGRCFVVGPYGADDSAVIDQERELPEQSCEGSAGTASQGLGCGECGRRRGALSFPALAKCSRGSSPGLCRSRDHWLGSRNGKRLRETFAPLIAPHTLRQAKVSGKYASMHDMSIAK